MVPYGDEALPIPGHLIQRLRGCAFSCLRPPNAVATMHDQPVKSSGNGYTQIVSDEQQKQIGAAYQRVQEADALLNDAKRHAERVVNELNQLLEFRVFSVASVNLKGDVLEGYNPDKKVTRGKHPKTHKPIPQYPSYDELRNAIVKLKEANRVKSLADTELKSASEQPQ